jgi:hypothetical protein
MALPLGGEAFNQALEAEYRSMIAAIRETLESPIFYQPMSPSERWEMQVKMEQASAYGRRWSVRLRRRLKAKIEAGRIKLGSKIAGLEPTDFDPWDC